MSLCLWFISSCTCWKCLLGVGWITRWEAVFRELSPNHSVIHFWRAPLGVSNTKRRQLSGWFWATSIASFREQLLDFRSCWIFWVTCWKCLLGAGWIAEWEAVFGVESGRCTACERSTWVAETTTWDWKPWIDCQQRQPATLVYILPLICYNVCFCYMWHSTKFKFNLRLFYTYSAL